MLIAQKITIFFFLIFLLFKNLIAPKILALTKVDFWH